ncbi:hypothetical protein OQA88_3730 [Cercophora sp. LCS_1]
MTTATPTARRFAPPSSASTIKPILRKRSASDDDYDDDLTLLPSSPIKKRKTVMFNEDLNVVKEFGSSIYGGKTSLDEAKNQIRRALEGHRQKDDEDYNSLKEMFAPRKRPGDDDSDDDEDVDDREADEREKDLLVFVVALTALATMVGRNCSGLVKSVLQCDWVARDDEFAKAYIQLLAALASAQGMLPQVLNMMVDKFQGIGGWGEERMERQKRLHLGLGYLLDLFPAGGKIILKLTASKFPYSDDSKAVHMEYVRNLLKLKEGRKDLERDLMELILSRVVKLDVEMTLDLENEEDDTTRAVLRQIEENKARGEEEEEDDSDAESVATDEEDDDEQIKRVGKIRNKLETMDAILDLLFEVYSPVFEDPDSTEAMETFQDLLSDFCNVILPHLKSRHTQYLLFKFALKSHQLMELFIGTLFNIAFESNRPPVVKQAAVGYLASFTARGAQVTSEQVQRIAKTFLNYIDHYRMSHSAAKGPDVRRYGQYYAYFQGLLYIFCFRWRDLIDRDLAPASIGWDDQASFIGHDLPWMPFLKQRLQVNIAAKLNPLKCCSPLIVDEFARLAHHLGLIYIYPRIEENKNIQLSQFFTGSYATGGALRDTGFEHDTEKWTHLEPTFPFDPYQLPISRRWLDLENTYVAWKPFVLLDREDETDAESLMGGDTDTEDNVSVQEDTATDDEQNDD